MLSENFFFYFQYTDWENTNDEFMYQRMIADIVGDYFFICPSILFAQLFADRNMKVYYYFFTQVSDTRRRKKIPDDKSIFTKLTSRYYRLAMFFFDSDNFLMERELEVFQGQVRFFFRLMKRFFRHLK